VLIVDDDRLAATGLKRLLASEHRVEIATDGKEALELLAQKRFDLVLCDLMMPAMSGMEVFEEVARRAPDQASRMLFLTGGAFTARAMDFVTERPDRVLDKPVNLKMLRERIRQAVTGAQAA
jgi:CheY-like chemotaxis protein